MIIDSGNSMLNIIPRTLYDRLTREGYLGVNMLEELVREVDKFIKTPQGEAFGMRERPDFFETVAVLFLANYVPEYAKALHTFTGIDAAAIRLTVAKRRAIAEAAWKAIENREKEQSRSPD